jgi:hypothetical protein
MRIVFITIMFITVCLPLRAAVVISEIACGTTGDDWVEIKCQGGSAAEDISKLYVTMYYGTNERLSEYPVTLYPYDRKETPYDDRFAVVHCAKPDIPDETDITGDTDGDGHIDIYCNNYSGSLWNAECVVAIDTNDDPEDGMIDFAVWSDGDGSPSDIILGYLTAAVNAGQWIAHGDISQSCMITVIKGGLPTYGSIIRTTALDSNTASDFSVTFCQTPGHENRIISPEKGQNIFTIRSKTILVMPGKADRKGECVIDVAEFCNLRMRVFTDIGQMIYDSGLIDNCAPGTRVIEWKGSEFARSGLYFARIDGAIPGRKRSSNVKIKFIVTRYR